MPSLTRGFRVDGTDGKSRKPKSLFCHVAFLLHSWLIPYYFPQFSHSWLLPRSHVALRLLPTVVKKIDALFRIVAMASLFFRLRSELLSCSAPGRYCNQANRAVLATKIKAIPVTN